MKLASKIILHARLADENAIRPFVAKCVAEGVGLICVAGDGSEVVHDLIDGMIEDMGGWIVTTWHDGEPLDEVRAFTAIFGDANEVVADVWL